MLKTVPRAGTAVRCDSDWLAGRLGGPPYLIDLFKLGGTGGCSCGSSKINQSETGQVADAGRAIADGQPIEQCPLRDERQCSGEAAA